MIKIAYVDDCKKDREIVSKFLKEFSSTSSEEISFVLSDDSLKFFEKFQGDYDILLLDIEMPILNGMELAKRIRKTGSTCVIIFITNMTQFAIKGYEVDAIGYVLKPLRYQVFKEVLKKAVEKTIAFRNKDSSMVISSRNGVDVVRASEVKYVEVRMHDLIYHTIRGNFVTHKTLKEIEKQLEDKDFVKCSHSYLINLKYVDGIEKNDVLIDDEKIAISRARKKVFIDRLIEYTR